LYFIASLIKDFCAQELVAATVSNKATATADFKNCFIRCLCLLNEMQVPIIVHICKVNAESVFIGKSKCNLRNTFQIKGLQFYG
jgi:hypothetical protein